MTPFIHAPQAGILLHAGSLVVVSDLDGQLREHEQHGFFAADTRVLSTYRLAIGGQPWHLLGSAQLSTTAAQWDFQNPSIRTPAGELLAGTLLLSLRRRLDDALHDDIFVRAFDGGAVRARLTLQLDADFADIFEIHDRSISPRLTVHRVARERTIALHYERAGFRRGLRIALDAPDPMPIHVGALAVFDLLLLPGKTWHVRVTASPEVKGMTYGAPSMPNIENPPDSTDEVIPPSPVIQAPELLGRPFTQGCADLRSLAFTQPSAPPFVAAGVPWFLTLFGRDPLVTSLMAGLDGAWSALGALAALAPRQARATDDYRDAQPGKFPHEARWGELAWRHRIPQSPYYYGAADTPALFCLALWNAWRWTGDHHLLDSYLETALAGLRWCAELGDLDGDGILEYTTRSRRGYHNQSWKDAGDAIVYADGGIAELPLATVELQGYWFAARLAMAELLDARGRDGDATSLRREAAQQRLLVEQRFWMPEAAFYAQALDGRKRQVESISSNPGQLLWCGLSDSAHVAAVARRLMQPDMFNGWGLRTLSSQNPAYNPLAYQRGSVWPHDTLLTAAGLWRYGERESACQLIRATLEAAAAFEHARLPELFCGLDRGHGLPVPYAQANSPQAWAAAAPILAALLFLGIQPDMPNSRCFLAPELPDWLPQLAVSAIPIGGGSLDVRLARRGGETVVEDIETHGGAQGIEIVHDMPPAPLWGAPPMLASE
ncbi:MAG TPA: glycogen debranching N-terminal domain-containing protein [Ktedonobacterales bacterium]|nr:glycogen debranching N-terminal domain-containing protein [Ktedonobacterales bacterium]